MYIDLLAATRHAAAQTSFGKPCRRNNPRACSINLRVFFSPFETAGASEKRPPTGSSGIIPCVISTGISFLHGFPCTYLLIVEDIPIETSTSSAACSSVNIKRELAKPSRCGKKTQHPVAATHTHTPKTRNKYRDLQGGRPKCTDHGCHQ